MLATANAMQGLGLGGRQARIDYHPDMAQRCLALLTSQCSLLCDDPLECKDVVDKPQPGSRIIAKIIHEPETRSLLLEQWT